MKSKTQTSSTKIDLEERKEHKAFTETQLSGPLVLELQLLFPSIVFAFHNA